MRLPPSRSSIVPAPMSHRLRAPSAFTLVELLVVIGIIAILVALTLAVGGRVLAGGKARQTADTIRVLDMALHAYKSERGEQIPYKVLTNKAALNANPGATPSYIPMCDGKMTVMGSPQIPTTSWFIYYVTKIDFVPSAVAALDNLDMSFKRITLPPSAAGGGPNQQALDVTAVPDGKTEILDGWKQPIRLVHPRFQGIIGALPRAVGNEGGYSLLSEIAPPVPANSFTWKVSVSPITGVRRNFLTNADRVQSPGLIGDSDGGRCVGDSAYFYSGGMDKDPSTLDDNVYTARPTFEGS